MEKNEQLQKQPESSLAKFRALLSQDAIKNKFNEALGKKAPMFISNLTTIMSGSAELQKCDHMSVISSALMAASMDLPLTPGLGFAGIVPYFDGPSQSMKAQFQVMKKGFIQLAQRTGLFKIINVSEVYEGELKSHNKFTGEYIFDETGKKSDNVIGYVSYFRLINGFEKYYYMPIEKLDTHAKRYSKSFQRGKGKWADKEEGGYEQMCEKTVLKLNLSTYAPLSVDINMMNAIVYDQAEIRDVEAKDYDYVDNEDSHKQEEKEVLETGQGKTIVINKTDAGKSERITSQAYGKINPDKFLKEKGTQDIQDATVIEPDINQAPEGKVLLNESEKNIQGHGSEERMNDVKVIRDEKGVITNMDEINTAKQEETPGNYTAEGLDKKETKELLKMVMEDMDMMESAETIPGKNTKSKLCKIIMAHQEKKLSELVAPYMDKSGEGAQVTGDQGGGIKGSVQAFENEGKGKVVEANQGVFDADKKPVTIVNKYGMEIPDFDKSNQRDFSLMKQLFNAMVSITPKIDNPRFLELKARIPEFEKYPDREQFCKYATNAEINLLLNSN